MQTVTSTDGTSIAYERHGSGPPLLLLHGGGTRRYWQPIVPRFAEDHTVIVPDRRGRGDSGDRVEQRSTDSPTQSGDSVEYSIEREIEDACAVIDAIDGEPILFGHSFGGLQAIEAARLASVAAVIAYEPAYLVGEYREQADLAAEMEAKLEEGKRREAMKLHLREVLHDECAAFEQWLDEWPGWPACVEHVENTVRMDRAIEQFDLPATLDINAGVLLLTGTNGPQHLRDSVRAVHEALPDSRLHEFDGLGHNGPTEAPDRITAEIRSFIH